MDCLSCLVDENVTEHDYEPKGQELGCTRFEYLPLFSHTQDFTHMEFINVLDTEKHAVKDCKKGCLLQIHNTLHIPSAKDKLTIKDNTFSK